MAIAEGYQNARSLIGRFALGLALLTAPALAQDTISLAFPVDCTLGQDCFLQQFPDRDPGPGARDYACGPQSYDGHTGTDIRVADFEAMARGVAVLAAAPGRVFATRDGVADGGVATATRDQGCGNAVILDHAGGWRTAYCHLAEGSVTVRTGDVVAAGTQLGLIGYSGLTEFPHLDIQVLRDGRIMDPFAPNDLTGCSTPAPQLWADPIDHPAGGVMRVGFAEAVPAFDAIKDGDADAAQISAGGAGFVIWAYLHSPRDGDGLRFRVTDADGAEVMAHDLSIDRTQAQSFRAFGRRTPEGGWPVGIYRGEVVMTQDGVEIGRRAARVIVTRD